MIASSHRDAESLPCSVVLAALLLTTALATPLGAQTNDEVNAGLQLDFSPPGARSLGLANAFVGLADDATAAYANPAGLLWLGKAEVSLELRYRRDVQSFPDSGNASGTPTGRGLDVVDSLTFSESDSSNLGAAFLSYVGMGGERWRYAIFRHELARFDTEINSQGPFLRSGSSRTRLAAVRAELELDLVHYGISGAWALSERWWLGAGLSIYDFELDAVTRRYLTVDPNSSVSLAQFYEVETVPSNERDRHVQQGDDEAIGGVIGLLWRSQDERWSAGLVYRTAPRFDLDYRFEWGRRSVLLAAGDTDGDGVIDAEPNLDRIDPGIERALSGTTDFHLPDSLSLGVAYRASDQLTIALQVDRLGYSNFTPEANILFNGLDRPATCGDFDPDGNPQAAVPCVVAPRRFARFDVPDTTELRLGVEWILPSKRPVALRFGAWHEEDHRLVFEAEGETPPPPDDRFAARFAPGDDVWHGTFGVGVGGRSLQVDLAADISDRGEIVSLSTVYRF